MLLNTRAGLFLLGLVSISGWASTPGIGSGIVYPTLNHANVVNPAALGENQSTNVQGLYGLGAKNIFGSAVIGLRSLGIGLDYTQLNAGGSEEHFGLGTKFGKIMLGGSVSTVEFSAFGFGAGLSIDMNSTRFSLTAAGLKGGPDRMAFGLGTSLGSGGIEADVSKAMASGSSDLDLNIGLHSRMHGLLFGIGYLITKSSVGFVDRGFWAGFSVALSGSFALEAYYKAGGTILQLGTWSAGLQAEF